MTEESAAYLARIRGVTEPTRLEMLMCSFPAASALPNLVDMAGTTAVAGLASSASRTPPSDPGRPETTSPSACSVGRLDLVRSRREYAEVIGHRLFVPDDIRLQRLSGAVSMMTHPVRGAGARP